MNSAILGLIAALSWGLHDFLGRFASRAVGPIPSVLAVTAIGLVALSAWLFVVDDGPVIVWPSLWLVVVTGLFYTLAMLALFAALALGPISIVAPITGCFPAPAMLLAVMLGARPSLLQWLAIVAVMIGVVIVSRSGGRYEDSGAVAPGMLKIVIGLALTAGFCFAISITAGQAATPIFGEIETAWLARIFSLAAIAAVYLWRTPGEKVPLRWLPLLALMGCLDVAALATTTAAGNWPNPEFATVVASAFSAVTVLLARLFLKEEITLPQLGGMMLIFGGVVVLAGL